MSNLEKQGYLEGLYDAAPAGENALSLTCGATRIGTSSNMFVTEIWQFLENKEQ